MKRRSFLRHASHSIAIPSLIGAMGYHPTSAQSLQKLLNLSNETDKVLVLIFLEGGNDGLNTVVPLSSYGEMSKVRPHVILPENSVLPVEGTDFGFHPSLSGFNSLYNEQRLQVIQSVGYPQQNFSHFRSTDIWMSASDEDQLVTSGWSGRYLETLHPEFPEGYPSPENPDPLAVELGRGASLLFQGQAASMGMVLNDVSSFYELIQNEESDAPDTLAGDKLRHVRLIARQSQKYGDAVINAAEKITDQRPYPEDNRLAQQLKVVSRLIAGDLKTPIYMVSLGGFDTHDAQVINSDHRQGEHADLLKTLNDAVMAFMQDLEYLGIDDRVVGMTFSEFGRRIVSNASLGTDHGSSAPLFVFGNGVRGGTIGQTAQVSGQETYEDNLPMEHDFRQVYSSVLSQWFETEETTVNEAMLQEFNQLPIFGDAVTTALNVIPEQTLSLYPNPVRSQATLEFMAARSRLKIGLIDLSGKKMGQLYHQMHPGGKFSLAFDVTSLKTGRYIITIDADGQKSFKHLIKI
ncbi:MAG: DUF1501 domain-containing protein [Cyclobacteriaceae bacterium]